MTAGPVTSNSQRTASKQADQTDDDQVDGNDVVQKTWNQQDQNACDQRDNRTNVHVKVHKSSLDIYSWQTHLPPQAGLHEYVRRYFRQPSR